YNVNLFCTNTPQSAHRHAFVNIASTTVFELKDGTANDITEVDSYRTLSGTTFTADTTPGTSAKSAALLGDDKVYFSSYYAMTSNETSGSNADYIYYANGDDLYYYHEDDLNAEQDTSDPGDDIYSMAYTSDYLLLGTAEGLVYVTLANNAPGSTASVSNASSTLSSYYEVWAVLSVDPSSSATAGDQYGATTFSGTSASFSNVCLWGFYPGRGKWNCE
nr:hypothetical protein [Treponema sp.]